MSDHTRADKTPKDIIRLRGVRMHNLKNIDLDIPLNTQIVVTGVSGSGKSSLAFDTLYAEGQRRYIESLSSYARQFLERMDKPDADLIEGITPAIAIQQKAVTKNPRSTVATVTEIYDFLRVLFARIGTIHCLQCGRPVRRDTIDAVVDTLFGKIKGLTANIFFEWTPDNGPETLKKEGFNRIIRDGKILDLDRAGLNSSFEGNIQVLADRMTIDPEERDRLVDSLEMALRKGKGRVYVQPDGGELLQFSDQLECKTCRLVYDEPVPSQFSFNSPQGACPGCHGFGDLAAVDEDKIIPDRTKSLEEGAVEPWTKPVSRRRLKRLLEEAEKHGISTQAPFQDLSPEDQRFVFEGDGRYKGVYGFFERLQRKKYKVQVRVFLARYRKYIPCPQCGQSRLNKKALSIRIQGLNISEVVRKTVRGAWAFFHGLHLSPFEARVAEKLASEIEGRLKFLLDVGLEYITLDRMTFTLSGGEAQRINLAAALSSSLVGTLFVLDEPSIGLHARDNHRLIEILRSLKELGNTVMVVEHDPEIIRAAEYLIDLGPKAGALGGEVLFAGPIGQFMKSKASLTACYMRGEKKISVPERRPVRRFITISDATKHNLKHIEARIPTQAFTCVTGVSGSGKSTLLHDVLFQGWQRKSADGFKEIRGQDLIDKVIMVDQSPISTSPRSIPATYTKAMDDIRLLFSRTREAKAQGYPPGYFSFNTAGGRCEVCSGAGHQIVEMQFLSDVVLTCEACNGKRFRDEILEVKFNHKSIYDVLQMSIHEAYEFFRDSPRIQKKISPLTEVGLGYLRLGQPTTTLSGGELQRIKLAHHLVHQREKRILYMFDEPTVGLHLDDVSVLIQCFQRLIAEGHTVVVIEHNLDVIKCADYIIDLGPEGGDGGGEIVAEGPPEEIIKSPASHTARYLKNYL
jgi:excinuclease ABC subunit A